MKPRIFISSTCYDLKFVREDLADFIRAYEYEPILSENGDIGYTPGQNLDKSCYDAMQTADMVILIIGSEYGSAASGEIKDEFNEYISITRNEFRTAIDAGIPVFTMIDKKVMAEYGIFEVNIEKIEKNELDIKFRIVKDINVFRFIKEIKSMINIPIQEFEKSSEIKGFISKQWADMFKNYLSSLRNEKENKKIESSVSEMKVLIQKMSIMLDSVGKNVLLKDDPKEYEAVINKQVIFEFCDSLIKTIGWEKERTNISIDERKKFIEKLLDWLLEMNEKNLLKNTFSNEEAEDVVDIFSTYKIKLPAKLRGDDIKEKMILLSNNQNKNAIIDTMIKDEYFTKLFEC